MFKKSVAVLLAAYNGRQYLQMQIESILNQENVNVTIYISVDLSHDETKAYLEKLYIQNPQIVLLEDIGKFGSAGKNFFRLLRDVDFSKFDFIAFADQDDIWYLDKLARAIEILGARKNADGYSSNVLAFWEDGFEQLVVKSQPQCKYDYLFEAAGPGCTYVMRKKLALEIKATIIKQWDSIQNVWLHDWFCYAYARVNEFSWIIDEQATMGYRQHSHNHVGVNQGFKAFKYRLNIVLNGSAIEQALLMATLMGLEENGFVRKWSALDRISLLRLAFYANQCRRSLKDKLLFFLACIVMSILGVSK